MTKEEQGYPSSDLIADITQIMRDADKAFETVGGSTRHYIRDVFIPLLEQKGFRFTTKVSMDEYAKQQAIAFAIAYANGKMGHPDTTPPANDRMDERYDWFLKNGSALGV